MKADVVQRLTALRAEMSRQRIAAYLVPHTDPHGSEYIPSFWKVRKYFTGFTGSAGIAIITAEGGALWTDSRYFLQAAQELTGTGIELMKQGVEGTPSIEDWLTEHLDYEERLAVNFEATPHNFFQPIEKACEIGGIDIVDANKLLNKVWTDRPTLPKDLIVIQPLEYAGQTAQEKIRRILTDGLKHCLSESIVITALDEIAWTLNLRGSDIPYNPVFISYLYLSEEECVLFTDPDKLTDEVRRYLQGLNVSVGRYEEIYVHFGNREASVALPDNANLHLIRAINIASNYDEDYPAVAAMGEDNGMVDLIPSPVPMLKAVKNAAELAGMRSAMVKDGVALVKFLRWLLPAVQASGQTELTVTERLQAFRAEQQLYRGDSFSTIAGYASNGAIVHYTATEESSKALEPRSFLLLDSGAQYTDGTTDITRTIALGKLTEQEKVDYTLVLKGMIALTRAHFLSGTCGTQLDVLARQFMWQQGINYGHGTGHGVGAFLNVHEGPIGIRMNHVPAPLLPGMVVSNEPGIYRAGEYGIRIENLITVVEQAGTAFGRFYAFDTLTLCPIDTTPIVRTMLSPDEVAWLNEYHARVARELSPYLNEKEQAWLQEATAPIQ